MDTAPPAFGRLKKTVILKMSQMAGIRHLSATMPDAFRRLTHRYMKELLRESKPTGALSYADADVAPFIIPAKTFAALVQAIDAEAGGGARRTKEELDHFHLNVETWLVAFLTRVERMAAHREHLVVQPKDVDLVWEMMEPVQIKRTGGAPPEVGVQNVVFD